LFEHQDAGALAKDEAVALAVEWPRYFLSRSIRLAERSKRSVGKDQQWIDAAIRPAGQDEVGVVARDQAKRFADRLRACGAGRRDRAIGTLSVKRQRDM